MKFLRKVIQGLAAPQHKVDPRKKRREEKMLQEIADRESRQKTGDQGEAGAEDKPPEGG